MGAETACTVRYDGRVSRGRALLETDALIFRGTFRLAIPFKRMRRIDADDRVLTIVFPDGLAEFELGARAKVWADRIRNPKGLLDKLGIKPGLHVALIGVDDDSFTEQLTRRAATVTRGRPRQGSDLIFLAVDTPATFRRLGALSRALKPDGAIWVVAPRGSSVVPESAILRAGKAARLVDVKVARFSETHTAHKFVIPRARRPVP